MKKTMLFLLTMFALSTLSAQDTIYFEFAFQDEPDSINVLAGATDTALIASVRAQLALPEEERFPHINGVIAKGTAYNSERYNWHFVIDEWSLSDFSIELCDGEPDFVNENVDYFVDTVMRYCPWSSYVKREVTLTAGEELLKQHPMISVFPNPTAGRLYLQGELPQAALQRVCLYNSIGQRLFCQATPSFSRPLLDLTAFPLGVYWLQIEVAGSSSVQKVILASK